jgi:hypothetical protein
LTFSLLRQKAQVDIIVMPPPVVGSVSSSSDSAALCRILHVRDDQTSNTFESRLPQTSSRSRCARAFSLAFHEDAMVPAVQLLWYLRKTPPPPPPPPSPFGRRSENCGKSSAIPSPAMLPLSSPPSLFYLGLP